MEDVEDKRKRMQSDVSPEDLRVIAMQILCPDLALRRDLRLMSCSTSLATSIGSGIAAPLGGEIDHRVPGYLCFAWTNGLEAWRRNGIKARLS